MDAAQYAIDIAARMTGVETLDQLDALTARLSGAGKSASHFQAATQKLNADLDAAKSANAAAAAALVEARTEYGLLEKAANKAALEAEKAALRQADAIAAAQAKLAAAQGKLDAGAQSGASEKAMTGYAAAVDKAASALRGLRANTAVADTAAAASAAKAKLDGYAATLRECETAAERAAASEKELGRTLKNVQTLSGATDRKLGDAASRLSVLRGALGDSRTSVGEFAESLLYPVQGFVDMSEAFGVAQASALMLSVGVAAVAVGIVALTAAAAAGVVSIAAWSIQLADGARKLALARDAAEALNPDLVALRGTMASVASSTGITADAQRGLVDGLRDAKVSTAEMPAALRAAALAEAALGKGGAAKFVADLKAGKKSVREFAAEAEAKFGGIVAQQMLGLEAQGVRFKQNVSDLFGGLNIEGALAGLAKIVALFDQTTASGRFIKTVFEGLFGPLIAQANNAATVVEAFILGFMIGATKIYIAFKPAIKAVSELLGFDTPTLRQTLDAAKFAGEKFAAVLTGVAITVGIVGGAFLAVGAVLMAGMLVPLAAVTAGTYALMKAHEYLNYAVGAAGAAILSFAGLVVGAVSSAIAGARDTLMSFDLVSMGVNMMAGLAQGILGGASTVLSAMTSAVQGAIDQAKSLLGIASPSKVFAQLGGYTAEGFGEGVEDSTPVAQMAMADMVEPPVVRAGSSISSPQGGASTQQQPAAKPSGASVDLRGARFEFNGVKDADDAELRFGELLTRILEGDVATLGGATP